MQNRMKIVRKFPLRVGLRFEMGLSHKIHEPAVSGGSLSFAAVRHASFSEKVYILT